MKVITAFDARTLWRQESLCLVPYPQDPKAQGFLRSLGIKELSAQTVLAKMMKLSVQTDNFIEWIGTIKVDSLSRLYAWLSKEACQIRNTYNELESDYKASQRGLRSGATNDLQVARQKIKRLEAMPVVMCSSGSFCAAKTAVIMAINVPVPDGYQVVLKDVLREDRAKSFLTACGVKQYGKDEYARDMKKMDRAKFITWLDGVSKNYAMKGEENAIDVAIRVLDYAAKEEDEETAGGVDFSKYAFVWASEKVIVKSLMKICGSVNQSKVCYKYAWKKVQDCCIDDPFEATGFATVTNVHGKAVLDKVYDKMEEKRRAAWIKFLKEYGMMCDVKVIPVSRDTYNSRNRHDNDYTINFLLQYLQKRSRALNLTIWKAMTREGGWRKEYAFRWQKKSTKDKEVILTSTVLTLLRGSAWIPDKDGVMMRLCDISPDTIDKDFVLDWRNGFLEAIGLGANEQKRINAQKAREESYKAAAAILGFGTADGAMQLRDLAKKARDFGIDLNEMLNDKIRQYEAEHAERAPHTDTIDEAIRKKARSSYDADEDDDDYDEDEEDDDATNAAPNTNRRREKVAKQMKEAGPEATTGTYCRTVKDGAVRQFLKEQYEREAA